MILPFAMNIRTHEKEKVVIFDLEGNIDINSSNLVEAVGWALEHKSRDILCGFSDVNMVDYVGISVIAVVYKNVLNHQGRMKLYGLPNHVTRLFGIVGLDRVFEHYDTEDEALKAFHEDEAIAEIMQKKLRRRFKRIILRGDVEYRLKGSTGKFFSGKVLNLSAIGTFAAVQQVLTVNDQVDLRLSLPGRPDPFVSEARVVWVADQELQQLESEAMGFEFQHMTSEQQNVIIDFVEKNLAADQFEAENT